MPTPKHAKARSSSRGGAEPTRRLITLLTLLTTAGEQGADASDLAVALGFTAASEQDRRDQVAREVRELNRLGHRIDNVAGPGEPARLRLIPGDDRVRLAFTAAQRYQLRRAAVLIGAAEVTDRLESDEVQRRDDGHGGAVTVVYRQPPEILGALTRAIATRCAIAFDYSGRRRTVHPMSLRPAQRGWVLTGHEQASARTKTYSLEKMTGLRLDVPGTAQTPASATGSSLDPLSWDIDPPATAIVEASNRFVGDVRRLLHEPAEVLPLPGRTADPTDPDHEPLVRITYRVTNQRAFLARLFELGERVRLVGEATMREAARRCLVEVIEA